MHLPEELAHGFAGGSVQLETLVRFLLGEELDSVHELAGAPNVSKFKGASDLEPADVLFLQNLPNTETVMHKSQVRERSLPSASVDTQLQASGIGSIIAQVMPRAKAKYAGTKI